MKIDNISTRSSAIYPSPKKNQNDFSEYLAESVGSKKKTSKPISAAVDMDTIRKKGFLKYVVELRKEKMREEILRQRGLTEEDLAAMSPEQRAEIEQMINEEIQKRLAAESELNNQDKDSSRLFALLQA
jgi:hypothetical protein